MRGGTSNDPEKRANSHANLVPAPPAPPGNQRRLTHGTWAAIRRERLDLETREIFDMLAEVVPVRGADGGLSPADFIAVEQLAKALIRQERAHAETLAHGTEITTGPNKGNLRGVAQYEERLDARVQAWTDRLGLNPSARVKLGLQLAQTRKTLEEEAAEVARSDPWAGVVIDQADAVSGAENASQTPSTEERPSATA